MYLGSQRSALAVVILLAIASGEGGAVLVQELAVGCAVFAGGGEHGSTCQREGQRESKMDSERARIFMTGKRSRLYTYSRHVRSSPCSIFSPPIG